MKRIQAKDADFIAGIVREYMGQEGLDNISWCDTKELKETAEKERNEALSVIASLMDGEDGFVSLDDDEAARARNVVMRHIEGCAATYDAMKEEEPSLAKEDGMIELLKGKMEKYREALRLLSE